MVTARLDDGLAELDVVFMAWRPARNDNGDERDDHAPRLPEQATNDAESSLDSSEDSLIDPERAMRRTA